MSLKGIVIVSSQVSGSTTAYVEKHDKAFVFHTMSFGRNLLQRGSKFKMERRMKIKRHLRFSFLANDSTDYAFVSNP